MFWTITVALFLLAILFVAVPLWQQRQLRELESAELRKQANIALFHERNNELEAELAAGNIDREQFDTLILELQQNLLADVSDAGDITAEQYARKDREVATANAPGRFGLSFVVPVGLALLVPIMAYALYSHWGYREDVELMALFQRTVDNRGDSEEAQQLIVELGRVVQANEDLPWAWYFLGENFATIGMFNEAQIAYQRAAEFLGDTPEKSLVLGRVALAMYINEELELTPGVRDVIEQARNINPNETGVLQLLASDAEQREDWEAAIEYWRLLIQQNPNSRQADQLRQAVRLAQQRLGGDEAEAAGPVIEVNLSLAEGLDLDGKLRVFVAARNAQREGMPPLAAVDLTVADLPATIRLDNSSAVGPFDLSSAAEVTVSALVSHAGVASPRSGDYRVLSAPLALGGDPTIVDLTIGEQVP